MSNLFYEEGEPAQGQKVMLATTAYDTPVAAYTFAIARSREALHKAGIQTAYLLLQGNCHVDDARNAVVRDFLESDCTELMFLDADVNWEPKDIVQLCQRDVDIVGGVYPYRRETGETMPVRLKAEAKEENGLLEVDGLPTGFLKIKRRVLEKMAHEAPKYFDKIYETALVFDRPTPGHDKTRWGGDIDFCNRWRAMGGKLYADVELRLGHTAKMIITDSLGAHLRKLSGTSMSYLMPKFRAGNETENDFNELSKYAADNYVADPVVLATLAGIARKCRGPIIETGSGLSSVLMAAVSGQQVYALEHIDFYAARTLQWAEEAGVDNVGICCAPLKDFWYDVDKFDLPGKFTLGFCDGPPRMLGTRMKFFDVLAPRCQIIVVDDIKTDNNFAKAVHAWAMSHGLSVTILGRVAMLSKQAIDLKMAA